MKPSLGVIGAGKVGSALARLLAAREWPVVAIWSLDPADALMLADAVGAEATGSPLEVLRRCDLTLLTVPDDAITPLAEQLAAANPPPCAVVHTSGALGAEALALLAARGMRTGSLHPAFPFAGGLPDLRGAAFAVEAVDSTLHGWLLALVEALGGVPLVIPPGGKAQYHAALVLCSNYTVTLYDAAERLLLALGIERGAAGAALTALLAGTLANLQARGVPDALTGPLVRADVGTLRLHLRALRGVDPALAALYTALARQSAPMLAARGVPWDEIERLLKEEEADAIDRS